jgi:hypothetical protein
MPLVREHLGAKRRAALVIVLEREEILRRELVHAASCVLDRQIP